MITKFARFSFNCLLLFVVSVPASGQQIADPRFNAKVEHPAFTKNFPRVLFDEAHNNFHTTTGRYKPFADLIFNDGYHVAVNRQPFTKESLQTFKILVIANALGAEDMDDEGADSPAFSAEECDAVRDWIRGGGALLFIADHAPFGSAADILARRLGVDMSNGFTEDPANADPESKIPSALVYSRQNHLLADHPITNGRNDSERVNRIIAFTGQSLKGPEGSDAFMKLSDTAVDSLPSTTKSRSAAGRALGIAFHLGKGRVVVLGEAGMLSAQVTGSDNRPFGMNIPDIDNKQLALNIVHWLSGLLK
ncbi:MAG: hypothetical protein M3Y84_09715 [Acidobacteriota bacterium]|nr:hypothetical protein [Acidobacteriota bacterium]